MGGAGIGALVKL